MSDLSTPHGTGPKAGAVTPREREVLHWLAQGQSARDIARRLARPLPRVERRIQALLGRLGVSDAAQALAFVGTASPPGDDTTEPGADEAPEATAGATGDLEPSADPAPR